MDVFLSYSRKDEALADSLVELLKDAGLEVWVDKQDIGGGRMWREEISEAIAKAKVFILLGTEGAFSSPHVAREVALASDLEKPILPLVRGSLEIPPKFQYALAGLHKLDLGTGSLEESFPQIFLSLQNLGLSQRDLEANQAVLRSLPPETLASEHERWLSSGGAEGVRAEVRGANFSGASFSRRQLARATFGRCDFSAADFSGSDLSQATFYGCSLAGASFRAAILRGAKLLECAGLAAKQFAGADLEGAQIPESVQVANLQRISGISKRAGTILITVLFLCVACAVAIASTTDLSLLTDSIPISGGMSLSASALFLFLPGTLLALWLFLQLTLQQLWEEFAKLPTVFPDGDARHSKADLWLFGSYVQSRSERLSAGGWLRVLIFYLLAWCCAPSMALACWAFYLRRHDRSGVSLLVVMIALSVALGLSSLIRAHATFAKPDRGKIGRWQPLLAGLAALGLLTILLLLSTAARNGLWVGEPTPIRQIDFPLWRFGQDLLYRLGIPTKLTVRETKLSGSAKRLSRIDIKHIDAFALDAPGVDFRQVTAVGAFLRDAKLAGANLDSANLQFATLSEVDLRGAVLTFARLELAEGRGARFQRADMSFARMAEADLRGANFGGASLLSSDFRGADLREVSFRNADLSSVNFYKADLRGADFTGARNMQAIKCISGANLAGATGLGSLQTAPGVLFAMDDNEYRRALAQTITEYGPCLYSALGWEIEGPPALRSWSVQPRSLRNFAIETPQELPRYLRRDIARFLEVVQESRERNVGAAFEEMRKKLGYVVDQGDRFMTLFASRPDSSEGVVTLSAFSVSCDEGQGEGFELRLRPWGSSTRIDLDAFIRSRLEEAGRNLGTERLWPLERGYVVVRENEGISFSTCPPPPTREGP
ncbi:MAG TPA: pentapeptide repeat-containing protein [Thermoanaerobaculia bacterium]|nr:pentapeptide repeat-containing protein [Thermoanaerobaculia bacterium]